MCLQLGPLHSELVRLSEENERLKHELSHVKKESPDMQMLMVPSGQPRASERELLNMVKDSPIYFLNFEIIYTGTWTSDLIFNLWWYGANIIRRILHVEVESLSSYIN